ncbi:hypothetical protein ACHAPQ_007265 [Fusarium lateritium]
MSLRRDFEPNTGSFDWMTAKASRVPGCEEAMSLVTKASNALAHIAKGIRKIKLKPKNPSLRPLPTVNFLDIKGQAYIDCILEEALPKDHARLFC